MRSRTRQVVVRAAESLAVGGIFAAAVAGGVVLHSNHAATRRVAARIGNQVLGSLFQGKIVVGTIDRLDLGATAHVHVAQAEILDPEGRRVLVANGIDATIDLARLVRSIRAGRTPEVAIAEARIESAELLLDQDAAGNLGIARAFDSLPSTRPAKPVVPGAPLAEDVTLLIPQAHVHHAWVHGNVVPPALDGTADDVDAAVSVIHNQLLVTASQGRITMRSPRGPGQVGDVHGLAHGELTMPVKVLPGAPSGTDALVMHWTMDGDGAGIPLTARAVLERGHLDADVDIPEASADVVRRAFPAFPLARPAALHAHAEGRLPELALTARGKIGGSAFAGHGDIVLREKQPFHFEADLAKIDGAAFAGPASDVTGHVHLEGVIDGGAPAGTFRISTNEATVAAQRAPALTAEGTFDQQRVTASFQTSEPGVELEGKVDLHVPEQKLDFDLRARSRDLRRLARAPNQLSGTGTAHAKGTLDLATSTVDATVVADGNAIARAPASAGRVHATARVRGPIASPVIDVTATAADVQLAATGDDGKPKEPLRYPSATARAQIVLSPVPRVLGGELRVEAADHRTAITASAREITIGPRGVAVSGARVEGLGAPIELELRLDGGAPSLRAKGTDIDVQRLATMTGVKQLRLLPEGTRATLDIDVKSGANRADGHFDISLAGAKDGTAAEIHGTIDGRHVRAQARVAVGTMGWVEMQSAEIDLPGAPSFATLQRATGAVNLRGEVDLSQGAALFGGESIEQISGRAFLSARIERADADRLPTVYASARTRDLDVTLNDEGKSTHIGGIDLGVNFGHDSATEETELSVLTWDETGLIANGDAKARVPIVSWLTGKTKVDRDVLGALQVGAVFTFPRRDVSKLPGTLARPDLRGAVSARAELGGTLGRPLLTLVARAEGLEQQRTTAANGPAFAPIDGLVNARWDGTHAVATVTLDEQSRARKEGLKKDGTARKAPRASGHARGLVLGRLPIADLFAGRVPAWNVSGELDVTDLELAPLPLPQNIKGALTGHVKLRDLAGSAELDATAHVDDFTIGGAKVMRVEAQVRAKDGLLDTTGSVNQEDGGSGRVHVVSQALQWHATEIDWDPQQPTRLDYTVDRMRLSIARTFVRKFVPEIDGRIDGSGSASVDAQNQVFEGGLALSQGRLYVNAIGEEVSDLGASVRFERNGAFRVQDVTGKVGAGVLTASATGKMHGLRLESAEAVIVIPSKEGVPISAEGATFAQATGEVNVKATVAPDTGALLVTVAVPRSKVTLPDRGTQNLQSLEPDESIAVGIRQKDGTLKAPALRPGLANAAARKGATAPQGQDQLVARFTVALGRDVELEGRGLRLQLDGRTVVNIADEVAVTGQIQLRQGGTIDVQGRKFVVDRGTVTFLEAANPADPVVVAAAYWDAPDRTRVWVEFNGPLKTGKLTLRSEPAYSKSEILSILLFGRADPNQASQGERPSDGQQAAALGTGIASSGLNKALGELNEDFDLEQDRTSANRVRTKVGYRLRRNLKVQLGYASGFSQREPDTTYLFLEWQFIPKWSLIGTRGDRGTSILDVLFQHRY